MKYNCDRVEERLAEYIDGELENEEKTAIENHLKTCAACNESYQQQQSWMGMLSRIREYEADEKIASPDLNSRILQAIAKENSQPGTRRRRSYFWHKNLPSWRGIVAAAAAVVLIIGAIQVGTLFSGQGALETKTQTPEGDNQDYLGVAGVEDDYSDGGAEAATDDLLNETIMERNSSSGWQLYSGSLAELPVAGDMFNGVSAPEDETTDQPPVSEKAFEPFSIFNKAQAIRVLYKDAPDAKVMFLLVYPGDEAEKWQADLAESFGSCTHTYSIEIIEAANMATLESELGRALFSELTSELDLEQNTLIRILIEE